MGDVPSKPVTECRALAVFANNYGAFLTTESIKGYGDVMMAKFTMNITRCQRSGIDRSVIERWAIECKARDVSIYRDSTTSDILWVNVTFWKDKDKQASSNRATSSKKVKKMNQDTEFYLALLQASGVKMVTVELDSRSYNYLCAIDVVEGQYVVIQDRNLLMVGKVTTVLEEWDMDIVEKFEDDLKWVISTVNVSNVEVYAEQKKAVFRDLRQSRLVEKAKKFAGNSNLDFNALVQKTQDTLAIEHVIDTGDGKA